VIAWHIDRGRIDDVDVSDRTIAVVAHIPGNVLKGNWRVVVYLDERATKEQEEAILSVWTGRQGGPVADLVQVIGEIAGLERAPISFGVEGGEGRLAIGRAVEAELTPLQGATGRTTTLHDSVFSTIPGSPAYVSKAPTYRVNAPNYGFTIDLQDHNAVQGDFRFEA
jgi:hypothetical protein